MNGRKRGFTLVELLVVIAIIGILIALLLPAVQAAREAARRSDCTNKQKQVMLGLQNYHDGHNALPLAAVWPGTGNGSSDFRNRNWGATWVTQMLPFIEQAPLHSQYNFSLSSDDPVNNPTVSIELPVLVCPSASPRSSPAVGPNSRENTYAKGNIAANTGGRVANQNTGYCGWEDAPAMWAAPFCWRNSPRNTRLDDCKDGLSNTVYLSEILTWQDNDDCRGCWGVVGGATFSKQQRCISGNDAANLPLILTPNARSDLNPDLYDGSIHCTNPGFYPHFCYDRTNDSDNGGHGARSMHPSGVNCALGDGSVRFVTDSVDRIVWFNALTLRGGEPTVLP